MSAYDPKQTFVVTRLCIRILVDAVGARVRIGPLQWPELLAGLSFCDVAGTELVETHAGGDQIGILPN